MERISTPTLLIGPAVLAIGPIVMTLLAQVLGSEFASVGSIFTWGGAAAAMIIGPALWAWRAGVGWARGIAWLVSTLILALGILALFVSVVMFGHVTDPVADAPLNFGIPTVAVIGAGLVLWTVLRKPRSPTEV